MPTQAEMQREIVQRVKSELHPMAFPMQPVLEGGEAGEPETEQFSVGVQCGAWMVVCREDKSLVVTLCNIESLPAGMITKTPCPLVDHYQAALVHGLTDLATNAPVPLSGFWEINEQTGMEMVTLRMARCSNTFQLIELLARVDA